MYTLTIITVANGTNTFDSTEFHGVVNEDYVFDTLIANNVDCRQLTKFAMMKPYSSVILKFTTREHRTDGTKLFYINRI